VLEAAAFSIFNPSAGLGQTRWDATNAGTLGDLIDESNAVAVNQFGMDQGFSAFDGGTVVDGDTFLHGVISFDATGLGTTNVTPAEGDFEVADLTGTISANFSGGTIQVVPEPSSLALIGLGGLLIARRRRG